jgi:hypothetical protein
MNFCFVSEKFEIKIRAHTQASSVCSLLCTLLGESVWFLPGKGVCFARIRLTTKCDSNRQALNLFFQIIGYGYTQSVHLIKTQRGGSSDEKKL